MGIADKTASFFAMVDFVIALDKQKKINDFVDIRIEFEKFILEYDYLIQQINRRHRTAQKSYKHISNFFQKIVFAFKAGKSVDEAISEIVSSRDFKYLTFQKSSDQSDSFAKDFNTGKKSAIYMRDALEKAPKCHICGGLIHRNSISIDHIQRKQDGGLATLDNGQITHPYCNTGYKN